MIAKRVLGQSRLFEDQFQERSGELIRVHRNHGCTFCAGVTKRDVAAFLSDDQEAQSLKCPDDFLRPYIGKLRHTLEDDGRPHDYAERHGLCSVDFFRDVVAVLR